MDPSSFKVKPRTGTAIQFVGAQIASVTPEKSPFQPKKFTSLGAIRLKVVFGCVQVAVKFFGS